MFLNSKLVEDIIEIAIKEDIGTGDVTTLSTIPEDAVTTGIIYAKASGVVAGIPIAEMVFRKLNRDLRFSAQKKDGDRVAQGDILASVSGSARSILTGERVALNLLQRLSGIATYTSKIVELLNGFETSVVDTRKTTPGLRVIEKYAVKIGGGKNHRFGLYDAVLIKDNHIKVAGGIKKAVMMARGNIPHTMKIEVETEDLAGVHEALEAGADIIMLDNMDFVTVEKAVGLIAGRALTEVSGGINEDNIKEYAKKGVNLISVGALTHSVKALDISLDVGEIKTRC